VTGELQSSLRYNFASGAKLRILGLRVSVHDRINRALQTPGKVGNVNFLKVSLPWRMEDGQEQVVFPHGLKRSSGVTDTFRLMICMKSRADLSNCRPETFLYEFTWQISNLLLKRNEDLTGPWVAEAWISGTSKLGSKPLVFNLQVSLCPRSTRIHLRGYARTSYINQNETQEPLETWTSSDPRTHEDSSRNWGTGMPETSSDISLTGQDYINNW
jgi:hypothetical protein